MLPNHIMRTTSSNMMPLITLQLYWSTSHNAFLQRSSRLFARNLSICYKMVSYSYLLAVGPSLLHMVPKKNPGDWHLCGDCHALNNVMVPERYPTRFHGHITWGYHLFQVGVSYSLLPNTCWVIWCPPQDCNYNPFRCIWIFMHTLWPA